MASLQCAQSPTEVVTSAEIKYLDCQTAPTAPFEIAAEFWRLSNPPRRGRSVRGIGVDDFRVPTWHMRIRSLSARKGRGPRYSAFEGKRPDRARGRYTAQRPTGAVDALPTRRRRHTKAERPLPPRLAVRNM
jgi:hypothetical protein